MELSDDVSKKDSVNIELEHVICEYGIMMNDWWQMFIITIQNKHEADWMKSFMMMTILIRVELFHT